MKICKQCDEDKQDRFYPNYSSLCKSCVIIQNNKGSHTYHFPKPKSYLDYVQQAGLLEYYQKSMKYKL